MKLERNSEGDLQPYSQKERVFRSQVHQQNLQAFIVFWYGVKLKDCRITVRMVRLFLELFLIRSVFHASFNAIFYGSLVKNVF